MAASLHLQLLGEFRARYSDRPVAALAAPPLQALLARLVLPPGVQHPRAQLAYLFWPDSPEPQARTNLRNLLFKLRRALPDPERFLHSAGQTLSWRADAPYTLDAAAFTAAARQAATPPAIAEAVALYRGDLLPGLYDEWLVPERERLRSLFTEVLERGIAGAEAAGDRTTALRYARRLIAHDPLHEPAYRALMRLSALRGDRAGVVRAYRACVATWERELGAEPSAETTQLYERLRAGRVPLAAPAVSEPPAGGRRPPSGSRRPPPAAEAATQVPTPRGMLPAPATRLVGRVRERAAVADLLLSEEMRLVTLTGLGGTGKTRLAIQVATDVRDTFADGVAFVPLAPIVDPELVASTIAHALGVKEAGGQPLVDSLKGYLQNKQQLLLLDNFEQVVGAAPLVSELLGAAPRLKVLVTSRAALRITGEHEYPVPPLALPDPRCLPPPEQLSQYEAVRLFIERARAVKPDFRVTAATALAVAEICHRLDGLPLALELAAARIRLLPPQALLPRLERRLGVLTGGGRDLPVRQRTLRNTIDWSYRLLELGEQQIFARLAVFAGGATLAAVEAVCNAGGDLAIEVLDGLEALVGQSLVRREEGSEEEPRFGMLETIREYATERLAHSGEAEAIRRAHAAYYLALAEMPSKYEGAPQWLRWSGLVEVEHDNFRAALRWSLAHEESALAVRLCAELWPFWAMRGYWNEARRWLEGALAGRGAPGVARGRALVGAGELARMQGDYRHATDLLAEGLALFRELDQARGVIRCLNGLASIAGHQGDYARAEALFTECLTTARQASERNDAAVALHNLGVVARDRGDLTRAGALLEESLSLFRELGRPEGVADALHNLGKLAYARGEYSQAVGLLMESLALRRERGDTGGVASSLLTLGTLAQLTGDMELAATQLAESLALFRELGDKSGIARCLGMLAGVAVAREQAQRAARLLGAAESLDEAVGAHMPEPYRSAHEANAAAARARLDEATWAAAWTEGRAMAPEQAVAYALEQEAPA